jgi:hypothetical protein
MKKTLIIFAAIIMMAGLTTRTFAQTSDMKSNDANAEILGAIALTATHVLEFGGIVPDAVATGTVVMDAADGRTKTGPVTLVSTSITPKSAAYSVTGTGLTAYAITIPLVPFNITNTTGVGGEIMSVSDMTCSYPTKHSTFAANGTDAFKVGGTLNVGIGQAAGVYTGTFNVTVAY